MTELAAAAATAVALLPERTHDVIRKSRCHVQTQTTLGVKYLRCAIDR